jgi:hypothetical protein
VPNGSAERVDWESLREDTMGCCILRAVLTIAFIFAGAAVAYSTDLTVLIKKCPKAVKAGQDLDSSFRVVVGNKGNVAVKNVPVEIVLKNTMFCPVPTPHAEYSTHFFNGVLLMGGRESVTLEPGQSSNVPLHGMNTIPGDTPQGRTYFLCAIVDAGDTVKESDEVNNCACCAVKVTGAEEKPVITGYGEMCIRKRGNVTIFGRNFGQSVGKSVFLGGNGVNINLLVDSWSDSMIRARVPDDPAIREGQQYYTGVRKTEGAAVLSNTGAYISICPERKMEPVPSPVPPVPPFLH